MQVACVEGQTCSVGHRPSTAIVVKKSLGNRMALNRAALQGCSLERPEAGPQGDSI